MLETGFFSDIFSFIFPPPPHTVNPTFCGERSGMTRLDVKGNGTSEIVGPLWFSAFLFGSGRPRGTSLRLCSMFLSSCYSIMLPSEHSKELLNFYFAEQAQKSPRMLCCQVYPRGVGCPGPESEMLFVGGWAGSYMPQICEETPANSSRI